MFGHLRAACARLGVYAPNLTQFNTFSVTL